MQCLSFRDDRAAKRNYREKLNILLIANNKESDVESAQIRKKAIVPPRSDILFVLHYHHVSSASTLKFNKRHRDQSNTEPIIPRSLYWTAIKNI